jgi:hypothetical protein
VAEEITGLWDRSVIKLGSVSGTNDLTATEAPALTGALVDGMKFELVPVNNTTSTTVRLNIDGSLRTVVDRDGVAPAVGSIKAGSHYLLSWNAANSKFYIMDFLPPVAFADRPSFRNILGDNGGFEVWQRGAGDSASISISNSSGSYTADRWYVNTNGNFTNVVSAQPGLTPRSRFCARVAKANGSAQTGIIFAYPLTLEEIVRIRGQRITISFLARGGSSLTDTSLGFAFCISAAGG